VRRLTASARRSSTGVAKERPLRARTERTAIRMTKMEEPTGGDLNGLERYENVEIAV
jgi:hypothetical protein